MILKDGIIRGLSYKLEIPLFVHKIKLEISEKIKALGRGAARQVWNMKDSYIQQLSERDTRDSDTAEIIERVWNSENTYHMYVWDGISSKTCSTTKSGARSRLISWRRYRLRLPPGFLFVLRWCIIRIPLWPSRYYSDGQHEYIRAHVFSPWLSTSWLYPGSLWRVWLCGVGWWVSALQGIIMVAVVIIPKTSFYLRRSVWVGFFKGG